MGKYDGLDAKIIEAIKSGRTQFFEIHLFTGAGYRKVDARLQALRRKGAISYAKRNWSTTDRKEARG